MRPMFGALCRTLFPVLFGVVLVGCKQRSFHSIQTSPETGTAEGIAGTVHSVFGGLLTSPGTWFWGESDFQEMGKAFSEEEGFLPADHPATERTNLMLSHMHVSLQRVFPELSSVPVPRAVIVNDSAVNAGVMTTRICVPYKVRLEGSPDSTSDAPVAEWADMDPSPIASKLRYSPCGFVRDDAKITAFLESLSRANPRCRWRKQGETLWVTTPCSEDVQRHLARTPGTPSHIRGFYWAGINQHIMVTSTLFRKSPSERHLAATLAHELAHYYRRHGLIEGEDSTRVPRYNFFYRIDRDRTAVMRPTPIHDNPSFDTVRQKVQANFGDMKPRYPGQKHHPKTLTLMTGVVDGLRYDREISSQAPWSQVLPACLGLSTAQEIFEKKLSGRQYGADVLVLTRRNDVRAYLAVDAETTKCMSALRAVSYEALQKNGSFSPQDFESMAEKSGFTLATEGKNLGEILRDIDNGLKAQDDAILATAKEARDQGLGYYTFEVEADELGTAILALSGFAPSVMVENFFFIAGQSHMQGYLETGENAFVPTLVECRKGYLNNWQHWTFRGQPYAPFFGQLINESSLYTGESEPPSYPSLCFRAYNVDIEARGRGYREAARFTPPERPSFAEIQALP